MDIVIIGSGPAGLMCAVKSSENTSNKITILDGNEKVGKKLFITGKGRCNICNNTTCDEFLKNVINNNKFLFASINKFSPQDTINFFEKNGTHLKTERGNRVFPVSDKSSDIIKTFLRILKRNNVSIELNQLVIDIKKEDDKFIINTKNKTFICDAVVIATGGKSYSSTGSRGDGYLFAEKFNHEIINIRPALVPIKINNYNGELSGLTLKNVKVSVKINNKTFSQFGEMLFTHNGVSGPIILSLSSYINLYQISGCILSIDLKPNLTNEILDNRLIRDFKTFKTKILKNYLKELMPSSLIEIFIRKNHFEEDIKVCNITKEDRLKIVNGLKNFSFEIKCLEDIETGIVTAGGVSIKEINPKNMQSKKVDNLFFIGEVLDLDALTGGFNIQIALSTGYVAGEYLANIN